MDVFLVSQQHKLSYCIINFMMEKQEDGERES